MNPKDDILTDKAKQMIANAGRQKAYENEIKKINRQYKWDSTKNIGGGAIMIGSALIPLGGVAAAGAGAGARILTPLVGRAIGSAIGSGVASGLVGGGIYGLGDSISQGSNATDTAKNIAYDSVIGGLTGGAIGGVGGKVGQAITKDQLQLANAMKNKLGIEELANGQKIADLNKNYYNNYIADRLNEKNLISGYRALTQGLNPNKNEWGVLYDSTNPRHRLQADLINRYNPANDDYHTWIRNADDIYNFEDTLKPPQYDTDFIGNDFTPDYTWDMAQDAINNGEMKVYSSYPIEKGTFVTPSETEALSYSGNGKVYSKDVPLKDVAWIEPMQGQYAPLDEEYFKNALLNHKPFEEMSKQELRDFKTLGKLYAKKSLIGEVAHNPTYGDIEITNKNLGKDYIHNLEVYPNLIEQLESAKFNPNLTTNYKNELDRVYDYLLNRLNNSDYKYVIENISDSGKKYKMMKNLTKGDK